MEVPSTMLAIGTKLPEFKLLDTNGEEVSLRQSKKENGLIVSFICNHCPYVIHLMEQYSAVAKQIMECDIGFVAISSNDVQRYPADSPEQMKAFAQKNGFEFPYLFDESQEVAHAFKAACTPEFYLFDHNNRLYYRGQFDGSRPGNKTPVTGDDLLEAVRALVERRDAYEPQTPSVGCNIKWKPGNEPEYFST